MLPSERPTHTNKTASEAAETKEQKNGDRGDSWREEEPQDDYMGDEAPMQEPDPQMLRLQTGLSLLLRLLRSADQQQRRRVGADQPKRRSGEGGQREEAEALAPCSSTFLLVFLYERVSFYSTN